MAILSYALPHGRASQDALIRREARPSGSAFLSERAQRRIIQVDGRVLQRRDPLRAAVPRVEGCLDRALYGWSVTEGIVDTKDGRRQEALDPLAAIDAVEDLPENTLVLLKDFHQFLEEANPVLLRKVKESLRAGKIKGKTLIVLGCRQAGSTGSRPGGAGLEHARRTPAARVERFSTGARPDPRYGR